MKSRFLLSLTAGLALLLVGSQRASANATVSTVASANLSADTAGGSYTALTGPVLDEGANRDIGNAGSSTIILNAPTGFAFDTAATVSVAVTRLAGAGSLLTLSSGTAAVTANTITITVSARDQNDGSTRSRITWSGIRVRPTAGTPLASGNITAGGTANITGVTGSTSFGALAEIAGNVTRLGFTTSPGGATYANPFSTQPVVRTQDQFGNNSVAGLAASLLVNLTLSTGVGPLVGTTTMDIGTGAGNGTATFSGLQVNRVENNDRLTAAAAGLTSALSATFNVTAAALTVSGITAANKVYDRLTTATLNTAGATLVGVEPGDTVVLNTVGATGTFSSSAVGTTKTVTIAGLTISGASAANYTLTQPTTTADITAKPLTVTGVTGVNRTYNGGTLATLNTAGAALVGLISPDTATLNTGSATGTFADKNVGTGKTVTIAGLTISGGASANYSLTQPTTTANISVATLTVNAVAADKVYDGNTTATINNYTDNRVGGDILTATSTAATFSSKTVANNKTVTITGISISGTDAGNYTVNTTDTDTANITARNLVVNGITAADKIYDRTTAATLNTAGATLAGAVVGDTVTLNVGAATGTFSSSSVGIGKTVTVAGLTVTGADAGNYSLTQPTTTANITPKSLTVSGVTANNKTYNATTAATLNTGGAALVGLIATDTATLNTGGATGVFADKNVGTGKTVTVTGITISGGASANYTVTQPSPTANITARSLTVTATGVNRVYDGTVAASVTFGDNRVSGDVLTITSTASFATKTVGNAKTITVTGITLSGADAGNYAPNTTASATASITPANLTITATGANKVYDATTAATVTLSDNRIAGDLLTVAHAAATFADKHVGSAKPITVSGITVTGADAANYTFNASATSSADITPRALVISATGINKLYDGTTTATVTLSDDRIPGDVLTPAYASATFADKLVGSAKAVSVSGITLAGADAGDYTHNASASTTADITAATVTPAVAVSDKVYDQTTAATIASRTLAGVIGTDDVTLTGGSATFADKNAGSAKPVAVTGLMLAGADAANYVLSSSSATATASITARALVVSATAASKIYDGNDTAVVSLSDDRIPGDDLTVAHASATFADRNVGTAKTVTVAGIAISGTDAGNYLANTSATALADITPAALTVTADNTTKVYGATMPAFTASYSGFVGGDTAGSLATPVNFITTATAASPVGTYAVTPAGATSPNYNINFVSGNLSITPAGLTITAVDKTKVYGDTLPAFEASYSGLVNGDTDASLTSPVSFATTATAASPVSSYAITLGGAASPNYIIKYVDGTLAVTPATLIITAEDKSKVAGAPLPALTAAYAGFVNGDTAASLATPASLSTTATAASQTGTYPITVDSAASPNYIISFVNGTLTVTAPGAVRIASIVRAANMHVTLHCTGDAGLTYQVEASEDLIHWELIGSATADGSGAFDVEDSQAGSRELRFYRAVLAQP